MNKFLYISIVVVLFSCKSNTTAQEKKDVKIEKPRIENARDKKPKIERPGFGDPRDNEITKLDGEYSTSLIAPNTIHFMGSVIAVFKDKAICGKSYKATTTIEVKKITKSAGIVNLISSEKETTFGFLKGYVKDFETLKQKLTKGQVFSFKAKESLCPDTSQTVYEIMSFEILLDRE